MLPFELGRSESGSEVHFAVKEAEVRRGGVLM